MRAIGRRSFVAGIAAAAALTARRARAEPTGNGDLALRDIPLGGIGKRMTLLVPQHLAADERVPLLVLLHGLGETHDERLGAYAWVERYGLVESYQRLRRPPVVRTSKRGEWTPERLAEVNVSLTQRAFRGFVVMCPFTPNLGASSIDAYGRWLTDVAIPRARAEAAAVVSDAAETRLGGCSLGGYLSLEIFLRQPERFAAWGGVQTAISERAAGSYADRIARAIARVGPRPLHLETSTADPFKGANVALAAALTGRKIPNDLRIVPGPHDQPWLREAGTIESLFWHDRG
jgi:pimeloyl-ACP methyl ester carboxylesterase